MHGVVDCAHTLHAILEAQRQPLENGWPAYVFIKGELPDRGFKFFAVPAKVRQFGTFPVRAFGIVFSA
jgi:hypothetical protein